jgi:integral membrane protein
VSILSTDRGRFRVISLIEGISYVVLLGVAMPLKYVGGDTLAVPLAGRIHGALFVVFALALARVASKESWRHRDAAIAMLAAVTPLGAFWLEHAFRRGAFAPGRAESG